MLQTDAFGQYSQDERLAGGERMTYGTLKQLVVEPETHAISAVDNSERRDAADFEDDNHGRYVPRLGSVDLMRLAASASKFGYHLVGVSLRDRAMHPLPQHDEENIVEDLVPTLRAGKLADAQRLLRGGRGPMSIVSVELAGEANDDDVLIGRMGTFSATSPTLSFDALVKPAWEKLHLS